MLNSLNAVEIPVVEAINNFGRGTFIDTISGLISYWPFLAFIFVLFFIWILFNDKKNYKIIILSLIIAFILQLLISNLFIKIVLVEFAGIRERPYIAYDFISAVGARSTSSSFPSSHVSTLTALLGVLVYFSRKKYLLFSSIIFIILLILSRIHNGMHYPSDVLAGAVFGLIYSSVAVYFSKKILKNSLFN
jgi:undecaprenyl-diphosphatase